MDKQEVPVLVCAADDRYAHPMAVMLYSAVTNLRDNRASVFVLDAGILPATKLRVERVLQQFPADLHWITPDGTNLRGVPCIKHLPISTYYRLLIPDVLPSRLSRCIYLDCDILVEADLGKLWALNPGSNYVLAVQARKGFIKRSDLAGYPPLESFGDWPYFNAGVMVMNLSEMRASQVHKRAVTFARTHPQFIGAADQDALNAVCVGRWGQLDRKWNWYVKRSKDGAPFVYRPDSILHFLGPKESQGLWRPWLPEEVRVRSSSEYFDAFQQYRKYEQESGWFSATHYVARQMKKRAHILADLARKLVKRAHVSW